MQGLADDFVLPYTIDYLSPDIKRDLSTDSPEFEAAEKELKSRLKIHEQQRNTFC
jgi:hypothetical protein